MANILFSSGGRRNPAAERPPAADIAALMGALLPQLGLAMPEGPAQEAYTLNFDTGPSVHIVRRPGDVCVCVSCEAGPLPYAGDADKLQALLALNYSDGDEPGVTIALHEASRTVVVWARPRFAGLDVAELKLALDCVRRKAGAVQSALNEFPGKSASRPTPGRARLNACHRFP